MAAKIRAGHCEQTISKGRMWLLALVVVQNANAMSASGVRTSLAPNGVVQVELDRGGKLNALNRPMWEAIADAVETSPDAPLVITSADPKAFSAGGDVTAIAGGPPKDVVDFLHLEYATLDALRERRNTIAVSDGIVMGAGAGVFMACATRVVTERARFAMPEVRIALVPDAGALRFLSKHCEPAVARFLAVTGYNLNAHDLVACGLATHFVAAKSRAAQESEIPNFKGSYLGRFPLVLAGFWTSDHLLERSRSVDAFSGTRARGTLTLKRR